MSTVDAYFFLALKGSSFKKSPNFICGIGINDNEICDKICPNIYKFELLIEHQKNAHNVEYSAEFFERDHSDYSEFLFKPKNDTVDKNSESDITVDENSENDTVDKNSESDQENQNSESDNEDKNDCVICVEKDDKIGALETAFSNVKIKLEAKKVSLRESTTKYQKYRQDWASTKKALEESKAESKLELEKLENQLQTDVASKKSLEQSLTSKIQTLEVTKIRLETQVASAQKVLEETNSESKVELKKVENQLQTEVASKKSFEESITSKIQTLEVAKIKLETEVASAQKALEESNSESKVELEKVENQLQTEVASKKSLEESLTKYRKLKQLLATKVFQSNPRNEDLDILLNLEVDELFNKYEKIINETQADRIKLEETTETLQDVKNKLKLQTAQRGIYEKQLSEITAVLHLPAESFNFANILPVVKDLLEQNETNHCSNGLSVVESTSSQM